MGMPLDTNSRTDDITDAITGLVIAGGLNAVTLRAIADRVGISAGTLVSHLTNRERILRVCANRFVDRRIAALRYQAARNGPLALLPDDQRELQETRVWLGWCELGRNHDGVAHAVARMRADEHWLVESVLDPRLDAHLDPRLAWSITAADEGAGVPRMDGTIIDAVMAVVDGLRNSVCAGGPEAMPLPRARDVLGHALRALSADALSG